MIRFGAHSAEFLHLQTLMCVTWALLMSKWSQKEICKRGQIERDEKGQKSPISWKKPLSSVANRIPFQKFTLESFFAPPKIPALSTMSSMLATPMKVLRFYFENCTWKLAF